MTSRIDEPITRSPSPGEPTGDAPAKPVDATTAYEQNVSHIGRPDSAGRFYAACADDFDEEICGCPVCRSAAHDPAA